MADVNVAADEVAAHNVALTANTVKTIGFARDLSEVRIVQPAGTVPIYVCFVDADHPKAATVEGKHCYAVVHAAPVQTLRVYTNGNTLLSLIASATAAVWVSAT